MRAAEEKALADGTIFKALSGFYYLKTADGVLRCRARGRFRHSGETPLVGDRVSFIRTSETEGVVEEIFERKNSFTRPPIANIDVMVILASGVIPVTEPFLVDRMSAIAEHAGCEAVICVNKCDLSAADELFGIYSRAGFRTIRTSAVTGEGIEELRGALTGKVSVFTGNSGVGKSSLLNALEPDFSIAVGEVSEKLGRGRHTTRHVELYETSFGAIIADTPGFSSFDLEKMELTDPQDLQFAFHEFAPFIGECRFVGCSHVKEKGCAVLEAVREGAIEPSRHRSYVRLYEQLNSVSEWERPNEQKKRN